LRGDAPRDLPTHTYMHVYMERTEREKPVGALLKNLFT
jgi:hypothetical protein